MAFVGPVLKNKKKTATKQHTQPQGNGTSTVSRKNGNAVNMPNPETRKYDPGKRARSRSPSQPPASVAPRPEKTTMPPKVRPIVLAESDSSFTRAASPMRAR